MKRLIWTCILIAACAGSLDAASATTHATSHRLFEWRPFLAPFHAVVLHFPIGFLTMAGILEIYRVLRPSHELRRVTSMVLWLGLATGFISATFGWMRAGSGDYDPKQLEMHRIYGIAVPFVTLGTLLFQRLAYRDENVRLWTMSYRGLLLGTLGLVVVAGHLGGNLTHGSKYLVENAPEFMRAWLENQPPPDSANETDPARLNAQAKVYVEKVQPILESKCYKCHGPEKQKGGYRVDRLDQLVKGGESGKPAIKPGDPLSSYLVRLILLPPQHDDVMPPEGKQPLTLEEIMTLIDWIRNGAKLPITATNQTASNLVP